MHSAPHRNNSDFQLRYFLSGSCHTPDGAWNLLYEQKVDVEQRLKHTVARALRNKAKRMEAQAVLDDQAAAEVAKMRAEADLIELDANEKMEQLGLEGARKELAAITQLMDELEPRRKYKDLPLLEATEASQREEWALEFCRRVENYYLTRGTIPEDHFEAMRKHPDFKAVILPRIKACMDISRSGNALSYLDKADLLIGDK